ncbi:MAG TPA: hypothetical protein VHZ26_04290 [Caulobacteraceae bacterium]|jgi:hypothetical protein|nr:hypothetical protein [Caulobacteraceae bacterium]
MADAGELSRGQAPFCVAGKLLFVRRVADLANLDRARAALHLRPAMYAAVIQLSGGRAHLDARFFALGGGVAGPPVRKR